MHKREKFTKINENLNDKRKFLCVHTIKMFKKMRKKIRNKKIRKFEF